MIIGIRYLNGRSLFPPVFKFFSSKANIQELTQKSLLVENVKGITTIKLNRPKKKNAFSTKMYLELTDVLNVAGKDPNVKVVLLTGTGDFYSSGNDLSNFSVLKHPLKIAAESRVLLRNFVDSFISFPKPLICAVNGPAIGIAVTTLGLCDKVFASTTSNYNTPFAALGQYPEGCSSYTFPRIMGEDVAKDVLWNGKKLTAQEAQQSGLIHSIHPPDELYTTAHNYCLELVALPPDAHQLIRPIIRAEMIAKLREVNEEECKILEKKWISKKCLNALAVFLESRGMRIQAALLRLGNLTGVLWGQPE